MLNSPYRIIDLIHTWLDLAELKYDGFYASKSVFKQRFSVSP